MTTTLYLISGPSGSGKTSITQALIERVPRLRKITTYTTRLPRRGEVDGVDYHFVSLRRFQEMELAGEFLETDVAYGEHYGLPMSALNGDGDLAVVITVDGARSARFLLGSTFSIFIMPPAPEAAAARIAARSAPNEALRVAAYAAEAEAVAEYDAVVVNDDFERTVAHVATLIELRRKTSGCAISATCRAQLSPAA